MPSKGPAIILFATSPSATQLGAELKKPLTVLWLKSELFSHMISKKVAPIASTPEPSATPDGLAPEKSAPLATRQVPGAGQLDPLESRRTRAFEKFTPLIRVGESGPRLPMIVCSSTEEVRSASSRLAPLRSAMVRFAPDRLAPKRLAPDRSVPIKMAPARFEEERSAPERFWLDKFAPDRFECERSNPWSSSVGLPPKSWPERFRNPGSTA